MPADYLPANPAPEQAEPGSVHGEEKAAEVASAEHDTDADTRLDGVPAPIHTLWPDKKAESLLKVHAEFTGALHAERGEEIRHQQEGDLQADHVLAVAHVASDLLPAAQGASGRPDRSQVARAVQRGHVAPLRAISAVLEGVQAQAKSPPSDTGEHAPLRTVDR